jgi:formamidopyrimidine-DNA glycosylase
MPELPEVEHVRRCLQDAVRGQTLQRVELRRRDLRWPVPARAVRALRGHTLLRIDRLGKYLLLAFRGARHALLLHLGMTGRVLLARVGEVPGWELHEHWRLAFDRVVVRFQDARRFGALLTCRAADPRAHPLLARLGPDPFDPRLDAAWLADRAGRRRTPLKSFLLDAGSVAGIGNIYASETCFLAGLAPQLRVHRLRPDDWGRLLSAMRQVLSAALAAGGTSFRDFVGTNGEPGWFQRALHVYDRAGEPCTRCGRAVRTARQAGRSTFWCSGCQRTR